MTARMRRLRWVVLGLWVAMIAVGVGLLVQYRAEVAGAAATRFLRRAGFSAAEVTVTGLGLSRATATLRLDAAGATGGQVTLDYPWEALRQRRLARIGLDGVTIRAEADAKGRLSVAGRAIPTGGTSEGGGGGVPVVLPVDALRITDATLTLTSPKGSATASLDTTLTRREDGGFDGRATVTTAATGVPALSPWMKGVAITDPAGTLTAKLRFAWDGASGLDGRGDLLLKEVGGRFGPVAVSGINGVIALSSLLPPVVPEGQTLAVKRLDVGLPLTDGIIRFGIDRQGRLHQQRAEWSWAGGRISAEPFTIDPTDPKGTVTLSAKAIPLPALFGLVDVDGLEATGAVSGRLPVRLTGSTVRVDDGVLEADAPGTLQYDPAHTPGFLTGAEGSPTDLLRRALTDFHYDTLRATVDGAAGGDLRIAIAIRGNNPEFYDGHVVALNLKVSGALDRILRQSLDAYRIPQTVLDRMTEFERKSP